MNMIKHALILTALMLFGCSSNSNSSLPLPEVNAVITLPPSASTQYLAWNTAGDLLWLDKDLNLINDKKLAGYSLQQVELLGDSLKPHPFVIYKHYTTIHRKKDRKNY